MKLYYDKTTGALLCNEHIDFVNFGIVTQDLQTNEYGGRYILAESMNESCAKMICKLLAGEWSDKPLL